jgi:hypothetical protein
MYFYSKDSQCLARVRLFLPIFAKKSKIVAAAELWLREPGLPDGIFSNQKFQFG